MAVATVTRSTVPVGDSALYTFDVTDPDSNLLEYTVTGEIFTSEAHPFLASERTAAMVSVAVSAAEVLSLRDTLMTFAVAVTDENGQTGVRRFSAHLPYWIPPLPSLPHWHRLTIRFMRWISFPTRSG